MVGKSFEINSNSYRGIPRLCSSFLSNLIKFIIIFALNQQKVNCYYKSYFYDYSNKSVKSSKVDNAHKNPHVLYVIKNSTRGQNTPRLMHLNVLNNPNMNINKIKQE